MHGSLNFILSGAVLLTEDEAKCDEDEGEETSQDHHSVGSGVGHVVNILLYGLGHLAHREKTVGRFVRVNNVGMEGQSLEERHGILALDFLEHNSELVIGDLLDEVTLELNNNMVSGEDGAESVTLVAKETEAVAFLDDGVVEACLYRCLSRHDSEVKHILKTLVADLDSEGEGLGLGIDVSRADLLELNLGLKLLDGLLDDGVRLVHHVDDELRGVKSETIGCFVVRAELWGDGRDASGSQDPVRSFTWGGVAEKVVSCADLEAVGGMSLSQDLFKERELDWEGVLDHVSGDGVEGSHVHVTI